MRTGMHTGCHSTLTHTHTHKHTHIGHGPMPVRTQLHVHAHQLVHTRMRAHDKRDACGLWGLGFRVGQKGCLRALAFSASVVGGHLHSVSPDRKPCHFHACHTSTGTQPDMDAHTHTHTHTHTGARALAPRVMCVRTIRDKCNVLHESTTASRQTYRHSHMYACMSTCVCPRVCVCVCVCACVR